MIGNTIREILDKKGMTQEELAQKMSMSLAHVNRIINGKSEPDKTISKIAEALGVPVHALYNEDIQITALAIENLNSLPNNVVKALGDKKKLEYILLGLALSDSVLSTEEIQLVVKEWERVERKLKHIKKCDKYAK